MKSGRELDALVADKVMGWKQVQLKDKGTHFEDAIGILPPTRGWVSVPYYSLDISAAWAVAESLRGRCGQVELGLRPGEAWCRVNCINTFAPTAPLAICLAALKAVGVEVPR